MKISVEQVEDEMVMALQEIFCNTVLKTEEGNKIAVCMRDDTIEMSVLGSNKWFRWNMLTGEPEAV